MVTPLGNNVEVEFTQAEHFIWLVLIEIGSTQWRLVSGQRNHLGHQAHIIECAGGRQAIDIIRFQSSRDGMRLKVDATWWREFIFANRLTSAEFTIKLGTPSLSENDMVSVFRGVCSDYRMDGMAAEVELRDPRSRLEDLTLFPRDFVSKHPAHIISQIWQLNLQTGEFTAPFFDSPIDQVATSDTTQWIVTGTGNSVTEVDFATAVSGSFRNKPAFSIAEPASTAANTLIDEMSVMSQGVVVGGAGSLSFKFIDQVDPVVATLTENECKFEPDNFLENYYNRWTVQFLTQLQGREFKISISDPAETLAAGDRPFEVTMPYANSLMRLDDDDFTHDKTSVELVFSDSGNNFGFAGMSNNQFPEDYYRNRIAAGTGGTGLSYLSNPYHISASNPCYVMIGYDPIQPTFDITDIRVEQIFEPLLFQQPEIFSITGWSPHVATPTVPIGQDLTEGVYNSVLGRPIFGLAEANIGARGLFGTVASAWPKFVRMSPDGVGGKESFALRPFITDVTPIISYLQNQYRRFYQGAPVMTAHTNGEHIGLKIGDRVHVNSRKPAWFNRSQAETEVDNSWRIVGRRVDPYSGKGLVELTLQYERGGAVPSTASFTFIRKGDRPAVETTDDSSSISIELNQNFLQDTTTSVVGLEEWNGGFVYGSVDTTRTVNYTLDVGATMDIRVESFADINELSPDQSSTREDRFDITNTAGSIGGSKTLISQSGTLGVGITVALIDNGDNTFHFTTRIATASATDFYQIRSLVRVITIT